MRNFIIRVVINAIAIALTATILPGIHVSNNDIGTLLIIGLIFGLVNAFVKPLLIFLTCPFVLVTFGLFLLVINGLLLQLTAWLAGDRLVVDGIGWAILGGIIMGLIGMILEGIFLKEEDKYKLKRQTIISYRRDL